MTSVIVWALALLALGLAISVRLRKDRLLREVGPWMMLVAVSSVGLTWLYTLLPR